MSVIAFLGQKYIRRIVSRHVLECILRAAICANLGDIWLGGQFKVKWLFESISLKCNGTSHFQKMNQNTLDLREFFNGVSDQ